MCSTSQSRIGVFCVSPKNAFRYDDFSKIEKNDPKIQFQNFFFEKSAISKGVREKRRGTHPHNTRVLN